jgi:hypothetical protein
MGSGEKLAIDSLVNRQLHKVRIVEDDLKWQ